MQFRCLKSDIVKYVELNGVKLYLASPYIVLQNRHMKVFRGKTYHLKEQ